MIKLALWWRLLSAALRSRSTRQFYDRIAPIYDQIFVTHRLHAQTMIELLRASRCGRETGNRIVDLGCGTGLMVQMLAESDYEVIGLDNSFESLLVLKRSEPHAVAIQADAAQLRFGKRARDSSS